MAAEILGGRLLGEIEGGTLEDLLNDLRKLYEKETGIKPPRLGIPALDTILTRHGGKLEITGSEGPALLYKIISVVVSPPRNGTIVIIDAEGRFDVTRLSCAIEDLRHIHIYRPLHGRLKETLGEVESYLVSGGHGSMGRECVGVCFNGAMGGDIMVAWKGWLKVESEIEGVPRYRIGVSAEEAMGEREQRQMAVDEKGWMAASEWGEYRWQEG